jgi:hypothetical protein
MIKREEFSAKEFSEQNNQDSKIVVWRLYCDYCAIQMENTKYHDIEEPTLNHYKCPACHLEIKSEGLYPAGRVEAVK